MQARIKHPALAVQSLGTFATLAGIAETTPYVQRFPGLIGREG